MAMNTEEDDRRSLPPRKGKYEDTIKVFSRHVKKRTDHESDEDDDILPRDSVSQTGSTSTGRRSSSLTSSRSSSASLFMLREKKKKAELLARSASLQEKHKLERYKHKVELAKQRIQHELSLEQLEIEQEEESLNLRTEMAVVEAKTQVLKDFGLESVVNEGHEGEMNKTIPYSHGRPTITHTAVPDHVSNSRMTVHRPEITSPAPTYILADATNAKLTGDTQVPLTHSVISSIAVPRSQTPEFNTGYQTPLLQIRPPAFVSPAASHILAGTSNAGSAANTQVPLTRNMMYTATVQPPLTPVGDVGRHGHQTPLSNPDIDSNRETQSSTTIVENNSDSLSRLADLLSRRQDHLPRMEPEMFDGDPLKFPVWIKSFEAIVEAHTDSLSQRLYFLSKYTSGDAREAIQGFLSLGSEAYDDAKHTLTRRYGGKYKIAEAFRQKINNWPPIKPGDGNSLQKFSDFLQHCKSAMSSIIYLQCLDDAEENKKMVRKLPRYMAERWSRVVDKWLYGDINDTENEGHYPTFTEFAKFIEREARVACGPGNIMYGGVTVEEKKTPKNTRPNTSSARSFATSTSSPDSTDTSSHDAPVTSGERRQRQCVMCKGDHTLDSCNDFLKMPPTDRKTFAKSNGLCYGCLKRGHLYRDCRNKRHTDLLSSDTSSPPATVSQQYHSTTHVTETAMSHKTSTRNENDTDQVYHHSMIVPVLVHHHDDPENKVITYALIDNQSNACFVTDSLLENFDAHTSSVNLKLTTMLKEDTIASKVVSGLVVQGLQEQQQIPLPSTYSRELIPIDRNLIPRPETVEKWPHLEQVSKQLCPHQEDVDIGLLIGFNCSAAMLPRQIVSAGDSDPYAVRTTLGWGVTGAIGNASCNEGPKDHFVYRTQVKDVSFDQVKQFFELDFQDTNQDESKVSMEDRRFQKLTSEGIRQENDGHWTLPLPFKTNDVSLPNNKCQASKRLDGLRHRLKKDLQYRADYINFMDSLIQKRYAEEVPTSELQINNSWYIPHHGVYNPRKPGKLRVVFDCSAEYMGETLNSHLLQGPDYINNLTGVLCRFRQENIAIVCDIENMFHQVNVAPEHRDYLRFLWFKDGRLDDRPTEYRMKVHPFGASSSPGCVNYALKMTADMYEDKCGAEAANFVRRNFYVDDGLSSVPDTSDAIDLIQASHDLCQHGGFNLHKYASSNKQVLCAVPMERRAKDIQQLDLSHDPLPISRTLGIQWCIENDMLQFRIELKDNPLTRRGILSTVSSIYDPLGLVSPVLLTGKCILQELCRDGCRWDDPVPEEVRNRWIKWRHELQFVSEVNTPRCYKPSQFQAVQTIQLHHFADASFEGYGECSYLRLVDTSGTVSTSLVMAKSRVTPSKPVTIPRLELTAAVTAVKVAAFLDVELDYDSITHFYWTDSNAVLGYIANDARRFHIFVANRVQVIRDYSSASQWNHIDTRLNPADYTSRGMPSKQIASCSLWWRGPEFLSSNAPLPLTVVDKDLSAEDPEVKKITVHSSSVTHAKFSDMTSRLERFSSWHNARRAVALCLRLKRRLQLRVAKKTGQPGRPVQLDPVTVEELQEAGNVILKLVQSQAFPKETAVLREMGQHEQVSRQQSRHRKQRIKHHSSLYRLDPYLGEDGLIHVGGRVRRANIPRNVMHPIALPRSSHITSLVIRHYHERSCHGGRGSTLNEIRASGFWIIKARAAVTSYIRSCVTCKKLRGATSLQKMADLPHDRLEVAPPFTYSGVDFFGPFYIKEGRSEKKRWGAMFVCLVTRSIHIEVAHSLNTDSFINAYRRFVCRRGAIRQLRSDQGTNFVGAKGELASALSQLSHDKIQQELLKDSCDWINFNMNVPHASHMGGVWERMIRSARSALSALLDTHGTQLDDELLKTLMVEAEAIVNSRPLTYPDVNCTDSTEPLSPSQILTLKQRVVLPPPGRFVKEDLYCRKHWRRVQYLANDFWLRWRNEYLPTLQERRKWNTPQQNLQEGDIVLLLDESIPRCQWPRARVTHAPTSQDGLVRKVTVKTATNSYNRPVHKLVLLYHPEFSPDEGATEEN